VADVLREINRFLAQRSFRGCGSGDSLFGGIDLKVGGDGLYMAQGFYASMGFAVPGAIGAQIGTGLRPLILTGDGGFQMTGVEIAHAPRYKLNPIVVLLNNGGWGIFRPIAKRQDLLTLPPWRYAELARLWGGRGFQVPGGAVTTRLGRSRKVLPLRSSRCLSGPGPFRLPSNTFAPLLRKRRSKSGVNIASEFVASVILKSSPLRK
jgi:TPP-dependent 2-oxoacid decarboxylase